MTAVHPRDEEDAPPPGATAGTRALRIPITASLDVSSLSLGLIALLAVFHTLRIGADAFMPIVLALLGRFALSPVMRRLNRVGIGAPLGAALLVAGLAGSALATGSVLSAPAAKWIERAPATLRQIERRIRFIQASVTRVLEATRDVAEAAEMDAEADRVVVEGPSLLSAVIDRTRSFAVILLVSTTLLFFLLAAGDGLADTLARAARPGANRRRTYELFERIERDISRHLLTITLVNVALGVAVTGAMWILDMPSPMLWGVVAGMLNYVPYVGALTTAVVIGAASLFTFDAPMQTVLVVSVFLTLTSLEGFLITPALLGRRLAVSASAVLISVLLWSWLWGGVGALIAVPLLTTFRILWEHVGPLRRPAILLGAEADAAAPEPS